MYSPLDEAQHIINEARLIHSLLKPDLTQVKLFPEKQVDEDLFKLIDIKKPYFALEDVVSLSLDTVSARIPVQQPLGRELGPISTAEVGRHLAILGVCSCALLNPSKRRHYYLAHQARYERVGDIPYTTPQADYLFGNAVCTSIDKRSASTATLLTNANNQVIAKLQVFYHVIPDILFERLYKNNHIANPDFSMENPYKLKHELYETDVIGNTMTATMGVIPEYYCAGHFPNYPALPVAILIYSLLSLTSEMVAHISGNPDQKVSIKDCSLSAENLAFAGDKVDLVVHHVSTSNNQYYLTAKAMANNERSVGEIRVVIEV